MRNSPLLMSTEASVNQDCYSPPSSNETVPSQPLPLLKPCQKKPAKTEGLSKIQDLIAKYPKYPGFNKKKITHHTKNLGDIKVKEKRESSEIYAPNNRSTKYMKEKVKPDIEKSTIIVGGFNTIF